MLKPAQGLVQLKLIQEDRLPTTDLRIILGRHIFYISLVAPAKILAPMNVQQLCILVLKM